MEKQFGSETLSIFLNPRRHLPTQTAVDLQTQANTDQQDSEGGCMC